MNVTDSAPEPCSPTESTESAPALGPITELELARILPFRSSRPDGEPYRLRMDRDYTTDAVRDGEPCPTCQSTDWRLVSGGLWLCGSSLHYWAPARPTGATS